MDFLQLYRAMVTAREIDRVEAELVRRGEASFHVSGAGHEGAAFMAALLTPDDWLHCHYRDKALMLARGMKPQAFFDALYYTDGSYSRGRQMNAFVCDPEAQIMSIAGPVGNNALHAVGIAAEIKHLAGNPISFCSMGDGTTQQGEYLEACAEAAREKLPVMFFVEDNGWAISTETNGKTFYSLPNGAPAHLFGMPIYHADGRDVLSSGSELAMAVAEVREGRSPVVVVFHVERLASHTNADDQTIYRSEADLKNGALNGDPLEHMERHLVANGFALSEMQRIREEVAQEVAAAESAAGQGSNPAVTQSAKRDLPVALTDASYEQRGTDEGPQLTMREAIREVLRTQLEEDPRVSLFGEDIADPKGDVFGVTKGLSTEFGDRVRNAPLSESTIVGESIGRALAGGRPVAFLQFADFLPLAYNQIFCELGNIYWRTAGSSECPVIVMAACGAYRPGLGPFHAHTFESVAVHTPGIDVFMPATAADAAGMLNAAFKSNRPTLFLYPKSALNDPENTTSADVHRQLVPIGPARVVRRGRNITLVGWGNTVRICEQVAATLETIGFEADVIDLRSLSPWDKATVVASAEKTAHLVVVHEDNHTCGLGAEVLATVTEKARVPIAMKRVTRADTYVPCNFANQMEVLPSFERVLGVAAEMLDLDLSWAKNDTSEEGIGTIDAVGSGPADETVVVVELHVKEGDTIERGDVVASLEATKSVFDLTASVAGKLEDVLVQVGDTVTVGSPLLKLATTQTASNASKLQIVDPGIPTLMPRQTPRLHVSGGNSGGITGKRTEESTTKGNSLPRAYQVGLVDVTAVTGNRTVDNSDLVGADGGMTAEQVVNRTGITSRHWIDDDQDAIGMAVTASQQLLERQQLSINDIDLLICTTTTPKSVTPSTACQVLGGLCDGDSEPLVQAYDINAACSGYLYAMQAGYDYLQSRPKARVMVVTAETLSPLIDREDQDTVFLFADASTATLLTGEAHINTARARIYQPDLSAKGDVQKTLCVPFAGDGYITMNGRKVFTEAVRAMLSSLNRACHQHGIGVGDLDLIVPHQANDRISEAIRRRVGVNVFSNIRHRGNTSSSSIPLCLVDVLPKLAEGVRVGLCAFGGGFTFGATVLETLKAGSGVNSPSNGNTFPGSGIRRVS